LIWVKALEGQASLQLSETLIHGSSFGVMMMEIEIDQQEFLRLIVHG
jgi:hypothetical protein